MDLSNSGICMRFSGYLIIISVAVMASFAAAQDPVYFADANLKTAVEDALWVYDPTPTDMLNLIDFQCINKKVKDITGLAYAVNLQSLNLRHNQISDISALADLVNLRKLIINNNQISDISVLSGLRELTHLDMHENPIDSVAVIAGLEKLQTLILRKCGISDLSFLAGLHQLEELQLPLNEISDIGVLAGLRELQELTLYNNQIDDISALLGLTGLTTLMLYSNRINDISALSNLTNLRNLSLYHNEIEDISPLAALRSLASLDLRNNPLADDACEIYIPEIIAGNPGIYVDHPPCYPCSVLISSTAGGRVVTPGEGKYIYEKGDTATLQAEAAPFFVFEKWSDPSQPFRYLSYWNPIYPQIEQDSHYEASFISLLSTIYVDDAAAGDLDPGDATKSDPLENGTVEHPFDRIQEAIDVAADGVCVIVRPGTYYENIDFSGKQIELTGIDPHDPNGVGFPVIDGAGTGPVVSFTHGEDPNCGLTGFVITRGEGDLAGGIYCQDSSPTIANCLIVGNRVSDPNGAAIYCSDSNAVFSHCTIVDNVSGTTGAGIVMINSRAVLTNSIVWDNVPQGLALKGDGEALVSYTDVTDVPGPGNMDTYPLFAQPGYWGDPSDLSEVFESGHPDAVWVDGDYHLLSIAGRWEPITQIWVQDDVASPCVDAGNPMSPIGDEPIPNGGIVNMGVYGGTAQGSKSD